MSGPRRRGGAPKGAGGRGRGAPRRGASGRAPAPGPRAAAPRQRGVGGDQVEGRQAVRELLLAGRRKVHEIWMLGDLDAAPILDDIVELAEDARVPVREVGRSKFFATARCEAPQGVLARAAPLAEVDLDDLASGSSRRPPLLVVVDGVTDPGNLGALLRSAECAGATGVVLAKHRAVHVTPTVTKAAAGAIEHLPIALVGGIPAAISRLQERGVWVVGLDGAAPASIFDIPAADGPLALVFGAEGRGLSRLVAQRCDALVAIPLAGRLESLNVAAAGAVALYEVARRRQRGAS